MPNKKGGNKSSKAKAKVKKQAKQGREIALSPLTSISPLPEIGRGARPAQGDK